MALLFVWCFTFEGFAGPVKNGILDLRNHNWEKDGIVSLTGDWEFYWNKFYTPDILNDTTINLQKSFAIVPDFWNQYMTSTPFKHKGFGYATYRLKIMCPPNTSQLALRILTVQGAYNLFINGNKVLTVGKPDTIESRASTKLKPVIVDANPVNNMLDIVMQVSNFDDHKGGLWDVIKIGTKKQIQTDTTRKNAFYLILSGILFLAFIYNMILFFYFRKKLILLFFSLLCFLIFSRILVTGDIPLNYIYNLNWKTIRQIEYIGFYFSVPLMCLFSYYLFPKDFSKKVLYIALPVSIVFILISLFGSYYSYTNVVQYYQFFMMVAALYGLYVYAIAFIRNRQGSVLCLTGYIIFISTIINDVLYSNLLVNTVPLFYLGLLVFILLLSIILSKQFSQTFSDLEVANHQLEKANNTLELMNNQVQEKNEELNKINHELDIFVNRTSHDLRAPLSSITGITYIMEGETNVATLHDYALLQQRTLQRMDDLINDIIDYSKNKRLQLTLGEVDFEKLINCSLEDHSHIKNADKVKVNVNILQHKKFITDERRLNTVINNLLSNALKYADVTKPSPYIDIKISVNEHEANIEVKDNGIGIDEMHLEKIFTMFYRATSSSNGSGLGLYIIKQTVEKLGGHITLHSKKGAGTSMKVVIPDKSEEIKKA
ncbi:MAG: sensor histidine kinase [Bacteroidetes bacterium]|nr:sensor histidine kinase [Bacteroidota bacterium]